VTGHTPIREDGFTLVELLVVILIIGILAAIAIPSLITQRSKAHDVSAKADARSAELAIEQWKQDHDTYNATSADLQTEDQDLAGNPRLTITGTATATTGVVRGSRAGADPAARCTGPTGRPRRRRARRPARQRRSAPPVCASRAVPD